MSHINLHYNHEAWLDYPGYILKHEFPKDEYDLRVARARALMEQEKLDALVITTQSVGGWFTSQREPHEWHDLCSARSAWYVLTHDRDVLFMTPTGGGEHFNTTRRSTWVSEIREVVERAPWPRWEIWDIARMAQEFDDLGLSHSRLGFELGDGMTLGMNFQDFCRLRELLPNAQLVDGSGVLRRLMAKLTNFEIGLLRRACEAGVWIHRQVPEVLRPGITEREFVSSLTAIFATRYLDEEYEYMGAGLWDVRNPKAGDSNFFHSVVTSRKFRLGDQLFRGLSGASYNGYHADIDRMWHIGKPVPEILDTYKMVWEANRAMAETVRAGATCSDVYAAFAKVERRYGVASKPSGRCGHGYRNTGGLSVHPDNHTVLEPGMVLSVEPMVVSEYGFFDLEDQYLITELGADILHEPAPEILPVIDC